MKKYYLHNGTEQEGPFDIDELKLKNISLDSPIWYEGIENWATVGQIDELKDIFLSKTPPPFKPRIEPNSQVSSPIIPQQKINFRKQMTIGLIVLVAIICFLYLINKKSSTESGLTQVESNSEGLTPQSSVLESSPPPRSTPSETYEQKVLTIEEMELSQPTKFLISGGKYAVAMFKKLKISGTITNYATVATYKDVLIKVKYYSKSHTVLHEKEFTIYDIFPPSSTKHFEQKVDNYVNVATIGWDVIDAKSQ
ncbi:MAG: DUF4339 domain-containing protein [Bacteroidia bacterium]